ncbi:hypothetical protein E2C06_26285 [Dankookia rubra]|uniref:Uncharacterized protein n=1 Tax=Dankookia rubra TaxID=1442381 RepID=A0A4R5QBH7_9PROT|nr:hypothetical protein [Dankookia rubra]TDH59617.1 hypothetical protein E2C06_26285 [Dankookia rubra]
MRPAALLVILAPALVLGGCTVRREVAGPPAYSQASPYAPGAYPQGTYARGGYAAAPSQQVIAPAPGSYCEEAVGEAQDAAARAQATGSPRDARRADRSAGYAARDCR